MECMQAWEAWMKCLTICSFCRLNIIHSGSQKIQWNYCCCTKNELQSTPEGAQEAFQEAWSLQLEEHRIIIQFRSTWYILELKCLYIGGREIIHFTASTWRLWRQKSRGYYRKTLLYAQKKKKSSLQSIYMRNCNCVIISKNEEEVGKKGV